MGSIQVETSNNNTGFREYEKFNLSDIVCIEQLILNRIELDMAFKCRVDDNPNPFFASDTDKISELMTCMYLDLERLINRTYLSLDELTTINKLYLGYDFFDIDELFFSQNYGYSQALFDEILTKIKNTNDKMRYEYFEKNGIEVFYETCTKCEQEKLVSSFGRDTRKKNGLKSICRECDKK